MDDIQSLSTLLDNSRDHSAGLVNIYYAPIDTIFDFPEFLVPDATKGFVYNDQVDFLSGYNWLRVPLLTHNKFGWRIEQNEELNGIKYRIITEGILTQFSNALTNELHKMVGKEYVLRLKDRDSQEVLHGDLDTPFRFSFNYDSGNEAGQFKGYRLNWTAEMLEPPIGSPA